MRVLVTGSRDWPHPDLVWVHLEMLYERLLDRCLPIDMHEPFIVTHGACPTGADLHASEWCQMSNSRPGDPPLPVIEDPHPADWSTFGKAAGFRRNAEMVDLSPTCCLAFILNASKGASHTAGLTEAAHLPTTRISIWKD